MIYGSLFTEEATKQGEFGVLISVFLYNIRNLTIINKKT